jgi:hypothetical protein
MAACSSIGHRPSKYALFENGHHLETIVELPCEIELDMGGKFPFRDQSPVTAPPRAA